jgi:hypothetical protein
VARIPLRRAEDTDVDPRSRELLLGLREQMGQDVNLYGLAANNPAALQALLDLGKGSYFGEHVDPQLSELAYLTASVTNSCHY